MNIGNLIFTLPAWQKTLVRKTEKENKKIANTESSLVYNTTCLKENLLPTYTNIYIYIGIRRVYVIYAYWTMGVFGLAHPLLFLFYIFIHLYEYFYNQIIFVRNAFLILCVSCLRI